jgi:hypothetical protein
MMVSKRGTTTAMKRPSVRKPIIFHMVELFRIFSFVKNLTNSGDISITINTLKNRFLIVLG